MLLLLIRASRWLIRDRGHGHTTMSELAAATFGWGAFPYAMRMSGDCWHEHPNR